VKIENLDKKIDMRYISHMNIGKVLRELLAKEGWSFRKMSSDLQMDRSSLHRSLKNGNPEWKTIERVLDYLEYNIQFVKKQPKKGRKYNEKV
jgi:DNA-binding phage protein